MIVIVIVIIIIIITTVTDKNNDTLVYIQTYMYKFNKATLTNTTSKNHVVIY